jgi:hypothetical protein
VIFMPMPLGGMLRPDIDRELQRGLSNREIGFVTGAHRATVRRRRRRLAAAGKVFCCKCGKPATHGGMCKPRYKRHPIRKERLGYPVCRVFGLRLALIRCREHTYKTEDRARRAFYRFIVKRGLYFPLGSGSHRRKQLGHFRKGYPVWRPTPISWISGPMREWREEFKRNWPLIQDRALTTIDPERCQELVRDASSRRFFQLSATGAAIS